MIVPNAQTWQQIFMVSLLVDGFLHRWLDGLNPVQGTQNIYAVLHQRSISIQHEHMCEVLGAQQVFVKHPQPTIHSKQSWLALFLMFTFLPKTEGTAIKQRNKAAKAQMLFPIEILPFVVSGTGPRETPLESDTSECLQVEGGTFHQKKQKLQNQSDKRGEHAFSTILCLALASKSLLIHLATSPTLPFGQLGLRWLPAQNHTVTMYPWAVSDPKQNLQCSWKSNPIADQTFAILPEHLSAKAFSRIFVRKNVSLNLFCKTQ